MPSIEGNSVLLIGGSSGIGFAVAEAALEQGARVAIASSNADRVNDAVTRLEKFALSSAIKPQISGHLCDVSGADVESRLLSLFNEVTENGTNCLDHVVYTAVPSIDPSKMPQLQSTSRDQILGLTQFFQVVPILIGKIAPQFLNKGYRSSLTFTSGQVAVKPSKAFMLMVPGVTALYGVTRGLAVGLAPRRVNLVSPGATVTELWGNDPAKRAALVEAYKDQGLLGKVGTPEEVAEAYIYLMRNSDATGSIVSCGAGAELK